MRGPLAALLTILLAAALVVAFLFVSGRSYLLQGLPGVPQSTPALAGTVQRSPDGAYWGAFVPGGITDTSAVAKFAAGVGRQPAIVSMYQQWWREPAFPSATASWLNDRGVVPLLVWEPLQPGLTGSRSVGQPTYRLSAIASGTFDGFVRRYADQIRAYGGPLFLEFMHEMNGNWYPWGGTVNGNTPADYVAAWRHVHDVFRQEGATNVTWTWTPNGETVPNTADNQPDEYWPGPQYVDWVGVDAYNWGTGSAVGWRSVAQIFAANVDRLTQLGKPIVVAETGSSERGGDKAAWISSLYESMTSDYRDSVGAVVWFDQASGGYDFRTNSSRAAQSAFNAAVAGPGIVSAGHAAVS
jgi:hypothetical protein